MRRVAVVDPDDATARGDGDGGRLKEVVPGRVLNHLHDG
jgi:hypothetical protein